jgi:hypothetical protein
MDSMNGQERFKTIVRRKQKLNRPIYKIYEKKYVRTQCNSAWIFSFLVSLVVYMNT